MKKLLSNLLVMGMVLSLVACGSPEAPESPGATEAGAGQQETEGAAKETSDFIKIRMPIPASSVGAEENQILKDFAREHGYELEQIVLPDPEAGQPDKMLISLMAGDEFDVVYSAMSNLKPYYDAGVIEDLGAMAKARGDDIESIFGDYLMAFNDDVVGFPNQVDRAITMYNKTLLEEKGVPLPTMENWTWDKYIETAKQVRDKEADIWGSFMPTWVHYIYMLAMQKEVDVYTPEGKSNLDDPVFVEAMEFYYGLGNDLDIQPNYLLHTSKNMGHDGFMRGNVGMTVIGNWALSAWVIDLEKNPRDFEIGIAPMPYPEGYQPSTSVVVGGYWVPTTSKNKEASYDFAKLLAKNYYKLASRIPARIDLTEAEKSDYIQNVFAPVYTANDEITTEQIMASLFNEKTRPFSEKPVGAAAAEIKTMFANESQLYALGEASAEEVMARIHKGIEEAIETELSNR